MDQTPRSLLETLPNESDIVKKARTILYLYKEQYYTLKEIASYLSVHASYISHLIRLPGMPEIILDGYYNKSITSSHLIVLSRLKKYDDSVEIYKTILSENLTSTQTELLVRQKKFGIETRGVVLDPKYIKESVEIIENKYQAENVKIIQSKIKSSLKIEIPGNFQKSSTTLKDIIDHLSQDISHSNGEKIEVLE